MQASIFNYWWGKLIGVALGWIAGGPVGVVLGLFIGHGFDQWQFIQERGRVRPGDAGFNELAFQLMGCLARADGRVTDAEIESARRVMAQLGVAADDEDGLRRSFALGKEADFSLDAALRRARRQFGRRSDRARLLLEILVQLALADGHMRAAEQRMLEQVCRYLGFGRREFNQLIAIIGARHNRRHEHHRKTPGNRGDVRTAYAILGVSRDDDVDTIKQAYRRLISQHHPDKLASRGLSPEMLRLAEEKTVEIRSAYDRIREARGIR
jgi:DnaJ like chaperone protein